MIKKLINTFLILMSLCLSVFVKAEKLLIATEHFPPYNYVVDNVVTGINTELVQRCCEIAKIECSFQSYPWLRAMALTLDEGLGGLYSTSRSADRESQFQWVGPLANSRAFLYRLKSRPEIKIAQLNDAKKYVIGVARGDVYEKYLQEKGFSYGENLFAFTTKAEAANLFLQGKIDVLIGSWQILPMWLAPYDASVDDVDELLELKEIGQNYLALNLRVPKPLVNQLQQALEQLQQSGEYQQILEKYQHSPLEVQVKNPQ